MPVSNSDHRGGITRKPVQWLLESWRPLLSEVISTTLLVSLTISSTLPDINGKPVPLIYAALATAFIVTANITVFLKFSGAHMNPALTLFALLTGHMKPCLALGYAVAQCVGAVLGFSILAGLVPVAREAPFGLTLPGTDVSPTIALLFEILLTCMFLLVVGCMLSATTPNPVGPLTLGLTVGGIIFSGGSISGASINPARSFGPAIYHNCWINHWVYWAGPLGGSILAAGIHRVLMPPFRAHKSLTKITTDIQDPEELRLQDKP